MEKQKVFERKSRNIGNFNASHKYERVKARQCATARARRRWQNYRKWGGDVHYKKKNRDFLCCVGFPSMAVAERYRGTMGIDKAKVGSEYYTRASSNLV